MAGCPECEGYLKDFLPSLSFLPILSDFIHPKRFRKHVSHCIPFLTEVSRLIDTDSYAMLFNLSKESLKKLIANNLEEKSFHPLHWLQTYFGIHEVLHSIYPVLKSIESEVITEFLSRGILKRDTPHIFIRGLWHSLVHAFLVDSKTIHIHHKKYVHLTPTTSIAIVSPQ
jgi:hypothetical protein